MSSGLQPQDLLRDRDEVLDIYLGVWGAFDAAKRRIVDFRELGKHARVLHDAAPSFFFLVQRLLIGDAVLGLCRVTDPPRYRNSERVSVTLLAETIKTPPELTQVMTAMAPLRKLRNNWISHADLSTLVNQKTATITISQITVASQAILEWWRAFGSSAGLSTADPVDQGTWDSAVSLTSALRDAEAVLAAYTSLLTACENKRGAAVDAQLTKRRTEWEDPPFSEQEWVRIRRKVLEEGLTSINLIEAGSPYMEILLQAGEEDPEHDITVNWTDRRVAARVKNEAGRLRRELKRRGEG